MRPTPSSVALPAPGSGPPMPLGEVAVAESAESREAPGAAHDVPELGSPSSQTMPQVGQTTLAEPSGRPDSKVTSRSGSQSRS